MEFELEKLKTYTKKLSTGIKLLPLFTGHYSFYFCTYTSQNPPHTFTKTRTYTFQDPIHALHKTPHKFTKPDITHTKYTSSQNPVQTQKTRHNTDINFFHKNRHKPDTPLNTK